MNQEIKDRWLAKLADPDNYPQGAGYLQADGNFCCWGVLCEVAREDGIVTVEEADNNIMRYIDANADTSGIGYPTATVLEWADIDPMNIIPNQNIVDHLANANDNGSNFAYIANEIREHM